jgi:hypothetical protein
MEISLLKSKLFLMAPWLVHVIPATQEMKIGRIEDQG